MKHCSSHGLRKAGATIASEHELMATFGWESPKQAALYAKKANHRLAGSGAAKITLGKAETANEIVPPEKAVGKNRDISEKKRKEIGA